MFQSIAEIAEEMRSNHQSEYKECNKLEHVPCCSTSLCKRKEALRNVAEHKRRGSLAYRLPDGLQAFRNASRCEWLARPIVIANWHIARMPCLGQGVYAFAFSLSPKAAGRRPAQPEGPANMIALLLDGRRLNVAQLLCLGETRQVAAVLLDGPRLFQIVPDFEF